MRASRAQDGIWDDGDDFALQIVQELFQFRLIPGHAYFEMVNTIFHLPLSCIEHINNPNTSYSIYFTSNKVYNISEYLSRGNFSAPG